MPKNQTFPFFCRSISLPHRQILVCGGRIESSSPGLNKAYILHIDEDCRIENIDEMTIGRSNHFLLVFINYVYVIGGCDHTNQFTNKCERLNLSTLKWEKITSCNEIRDTCSACGIEDQNCIYVFGGRVGNNEISKTFERFEVSRNSWVKINISLPVFSSVHGTAIVGNKQFLIFAGQDFENKPLKNACVFDLNKGKFEDIEPMASKGGCIVNEIVVYRNRVYCFLFQGFACRSLEFWDIENRKWRVDSVS